MENKIEKLLKKYGLNSDSEFYLDSILWQLGEDNMKTARILVKTCRFASKFEDSSELLKIIDKHVEDYLKHNKENKLIDMAHFNKLFKHLECQYRLAKLINESHYTY